ncbi:hypothetical protein BH10PSE6_BH10PSE6_02100 [soil metagenome]
MRSIAILAAVAAVSFTAAPVVAQAQSTTTTIKTEASAIWEKINGSWTQTKGAVKEQWGRLTDDDLMEIQGRRDQLVGKIQTRYGISKPEAEAQVSGWEHKYKSM